MHKHTTGAESAEIPLIRALCALLPQFSGACKQRRVYVRMVVLLLTKLAVVGRQTVAQMVLTLGQGIEWSAMYRLFSRRRVDVDVLTAVLLRETLVHAPAAQPYVVGVDATHIVRSSKRMPLSGWMRAPQTAPFMRGIQPGQRFEHCAFLTPIEAGYSRAIPLRFVPAPPPSAVADARQVVTEWQAAVQLVGWVRQTLDQAGRCQQPLLVLGDGAYNTLEFWKRLPAHTWGLTRTAKNSCLYALPPLAAGRGRPRKYGERAPTPQEQLHLAGGWQRCTVEVRGRTLPLRYRVEGPFLRKGAPDRPLFLLVVGGATYQVGKRRPHTKERPPAYYLVSAVADGKGGWQLPLPAETLLAWAWQRWEVEVAHREMKSGLGVGEMQCWSQHAAATSIQWCAWVYALLILVAYRTWGLTGGPLPPGKWQLRRHRRWSLNTVWRTYRTELWSHADFASVALRSAADWPKIHNWTHTLLNATLDNGVT